MSARFASALGAIVVMFAAALTACQNDDTMPPDVLVDFDARGHFADGAAPIIDVPAESDGALDAAPDDATDASVEAE